MREPFAIGHRCNSLMPDCLVTLARTQSCLDEFQAILHGVIVEVAKLFLLRAILALLITLSLATAPIGAAMAQGQARHEMPAMAGDMDDCAKMMGQTGSKSDCPCCDTKSACPPELCLTKCFKVFRATLAPDAVPVMVSIALRPGEPARPPDWCYGPQPPPPRT